MNEHTKEDEETLASAIDAQERVRAERREANRARFWANVTRREIRNATRTQPVGWF